MMLMISGALTPCQMAKSTGGKWPPTTGVAAACKMAPTVQAGKMPTTKQINTKSSTGTRIQCGGSCGVRGKSCAGGPKNTSTVNRSEEATLNMPAKVAAKGEAMG